jgi:hypothetical protein
MILLVMGLDSGCRFCRLLHYADGVLFGDTLFWECVAA